MLRKKFNTGDKVRLDKDFHNTSIVEVVAQSPMKLYTRVKSNDTEWDVMTVLLDELNYPTEDK